MKSSCGSSWGFSILDLESFHLRRASTAFSMVERPTLVVAAEAAEAEEGGRDSIGIFGQVKAILVIELKIASAGEK